MISIPDRRETITLIKKARQSGARLEKACAETGISSRTCQRWTGGEDIKSDGRPTADRPAPANKLTKEEKKHILDICHKPEYASMPPGQIVPRLADRGEYIASESTFYRILRNAKEQHHRGRSQKPKKVAPPKGHLATGPNQVWSWDITWLPAPIRGMFFYLYMIMDIYSRKIVGWEIHSIESSDLSAVLIQKAVLAEGCVFDLLVLHADNGAPQKGFTMKAKLESLGIMASYSRPRVSNDNPYSEALFRTAKYRPGYPEKGFNDINDARKWCADFVKWYNNVHFHSAIRYVSPAQRHKHQDIVLLENRKKVYQQAKETHPERWSQGTRNWEYINQVWLNCPKNNKILTNEKMVA